MNANLFYDQEKSCNCVLRRKLNQFYTEDRFCDVFVEVQEQIFRCHRVVLASVSEYFDALFRSNPEDCCVQETVLLDINAGVFEEILKFSYTEKKPSITDNNVFDLLRASDFLGVQSFVEHCVDYIRQCELSIEKIFEIFMFAHVTNNESLMDIISDYIIEKFNVLSLKEEFLTLPIEVLNLVLRKYELSPELSLPRIFRDEDVLLDALIRWVSHSPGERAVHLEEILRLVDFRKISCCYEVFLMKKFKIDRIVDWDAVSLRKHLCEYLLSKDPISNDFVSASPVVCENISKLGLHAFINFKSDEDDSVALNIFSANKYNSKWSYCQKNPSPYHHACMKVVTLGESHNYLYSMRYDLIDEYAPTFFASASVTLDLKRKLACPPTNFSGGSFHICAVPNTMNIYFSHDNESTVYLYNCHMDIWFPMTKMSENMKGSCMVANNDLLYFVGGSANYSKSGFVQAYDNRNLKWLKLPRTNRKYSFAASTSLDGKIYVSDGYGLEVLDPEAGKWETLSYPDMNRRKTNCDNHRMVAYENQVWIISTRLQKNKFEGNEADDWCDIQVFNPRNRTWQASKSLNNMINHHRRYNNETGYYTNKFGSFLKSSSLQDFVVF